MTPIAHPVAEDRQGGDREGRVGGHRDAPTPALLPSAGNQQEDQHRKDDAPRRCRNGQRRHLGLSQIADHDLALDLQRNHEEEDRHQAVVDPVLKVLLDAEVADPEAELGVPERLVAGAAQEVDPDQRNSRSAQQRESATRLGAQELRHRAQGLRNLSSAPYSFTLQPVDVLAAGPTRGNVLDLAELAQRRREDRAQMGLALGAEQLAGYRRLGKLDAKLDASVTLDLDLTDWKRRRGPAEVEVRRSEQRRRLLGER